MEFHAELAEHPVGLAPEVVLLRGLDLDAAVPEETAEIPLLHRVEGAEDRGLAVRLDAVELLLGLAPLPVEVGHPAALRGLPSVQLLDLLNLLAGGLGHSFTSDDQEREHGDHEHGEAVPEAIRDLPRVEAAREDTVPECMHDHGHEERDLD